MTLRDPSRPAARWPFWLLVVAWFFANSPQAAVYELLDWAGHARHFTHQHRLKRDVAFLLAGGNASGPAIAATSAPARPLPPSLPAEAVLKKIELALPVAGETLLRAMRAVLPAIREKEAHDTGREPPPHGPPRHLA